MGDVIAVDGSSLEELVQILIDQQSLAAQWEIGILAFTVAVVLVLGIYLLLKMR